MDLRGWSNRELASYRRQAAPARSALTRAESAPPDYHGRPVTIAPMSGHHRRWHRQFLGTTGTVTSTKVTQGADFVIAITG